MHTDDLRALLAERATDADGGAPAMDARLAGIHDKAHGIRMRRLGGAVIAATVILALSVGGGAVLQVDDPDPASPSSDLELPEYSHGGVKIGETSVLGPETTSSVTVTPEEFPLVVVVECDRSVRIDVTAEQAGSEPFGLSGGECAEWGRVSRYEEPLPGDEPSIDLGEPVALTLTVEGVYDDTRTQTPAFPDGGVALGVYESVPWDEYRFPARPDELVDLGEQMGDGPRNGHVVESADDPNEPVITQFVGDGVSIDLRSQTPGRMKIYIDGEEVGSATFWDYTGASFKYDTGWEGFEYAKLPSEGVEITFVPQDFTGAWRADVVQCTEYDDGSVGCGPCSRSWRAPSLTYCLIRRHVRCLSAKIHIPTWQISGAACLVMDPRHSCTGRRCSFEGSPRSSCGGSRVAGERIRSALDRPRHADGSRDERVLQLRSLRHGVARNESPGATSSGPRLGRYQT